jgi:hypothetical protein
MFVESHHAKNEWPFYSRGNDIMVDMVAVGDVVGEKKRKFI